ncbi:hypothetical protein GIB67_024593 [Kingdonia uniflora]|uniref:Uncharacterized protein n=1 Tax=Kingdonia uniflora TaxID=39325 RepID=A0A7J7LNX8_9MAGN|nr:hypothetical protein GIB67_024593 [Kingdonia uniflora]
MKSNREVNKQFEEENQTQDSGAKKSTSNAKNYTSRCTGLGLHKMFVALPEEENGVLRTTCFAPLLMIDLITTLSTLVVEIFDRHLGDMKLRQFPKKKNIYGLKEIDDALKWAKLERHHDDVLRLNLLKIILSFLLPNKGKNVWVNLKFPSFEESIHLFPKLQGWRMKSFKRRQIVTFKKFFANPKLLVIAMKSSETDIQQDLVQEAIIIFHSLNHIEAPAIDVAPAIEPPAVDVPVVGAPSIGSCSSATEVGVIVVRVYSQLEEHVGGNTLPLEDTPLLGQYQFSTPKKIMKRKRERGTKKEDGKRMKAEPRTWQRDLQQKNQKIKEKKKGKGEWQKKLQVAPGTGLEVVKKLLVDADVEVRMEVNFKAISFKYGGDLLEWEKGNEKDDDDKKDVEEKVKFEEEQPQVTEEEDSELPTVVVYYNRNKDVQHANEVAKTDIIFFNQEEVIGEAYQACADQITIVSVEEQTMEIEKTKDEASQASADQTIAIFVEEQTIEVTQTEVVISYQEEDVGEASQFVLIESKVDVTLKKRHTLTKDEINERAFKMAC